MAALRSRDGATGRCWRAAARRATRDRRRSRAARSRLHRCWGALRRTPGRRDSRFGTAATGCTSPYRRGIRPRTRTIRDRGRRCSWDGGRSSSGPCQSVQLNPSGTGGPVVVHPGIPGARTAGWSSCAPRARYRSRRHRSRRQGCDDRRCCCTRADGMRSCSPAPHQPRMADFLEHARQRLVRDRGLSLPERAATLMPPCWWSA